MNILLKCRMCKEDFLLEVKLVDYDRWLHGEVIQKAMPYLSADERELLISHTCGNCFNSIFEEDET